jgi:hypothetical protein
MMRNLIEFPITLNEVIECLERCKAECNPDLIGDMRPVLLQRAIQIVKREKFFHGED